MPLCHLQSVGHGTALGSRAREVELGVGLGCTSPPASLHPPRAGKQGVTSTARWDARDAALQIMTVLSPTLPGRNTKAALLS